MATTKCSVCSVELKADTQEALNDIIFYHHMISHARANFCDNLGHGPVEYLGTGMD